MRRGTLVAMIAGLLAVAGAARANSIFDYLHFSDASVWQGNHLYRIYVHGRRNTLLLQPALGDMNGPAFAWPAAEWRAAADHFVEPLGCTIAQTQLLTNSGPSWEATYYCPLGVDLPTVVRQQSDAAKNGAPLQP